MNLLAKFSKVLSFQNKMKESINSIYIGSNPKTISED